MKFDVNGRGVYELPLRLAHGGVHVSEIEQVGIEQIIDFNPRGLKEYPITQHLVHHGCVTNDFWLGVDGFQHRKYGHNYTDNTIRNGLWLLVILQSLYVHM